MAGIGGAAGVQRTIRRLGSLPEREGMSVSAPIIQAIRDLRQLPESVLHTAQELAHRASIYGIAPVSISYLAKKCHCSRQTIINHLKKLKSLGIISWRVIWIKNNFCQINRYRFLIPWDKKPAQMCNSQKVGQKLPPPKREEEKFGLTPSPEKTQTWLQQALGHDSPFARLCLGQEERNL